MWKIATIGIKYSRCFTILDFDKLPFNSLTKLEISIANKIELEKFKTFFDKHKNDFIKLEQLNITFLLVDDINYNIKELFDNLPPSLKQLNINNENIMNRMVLSN